MMHLDRTPLMLHYSSSYLIFKMHAHLHLTECYANRTCIQKNTYTIKNYNKYNVIIFTILNS